MYSRRTAQPNHEMKVHAQQTIVEAIKDSKSTTTTKGSQENLIEKKQREEKWGSGVQRHQHMEA